MKALEEKIGYKFKKQQLLAHALRHSSVGSVSNERLEFLGDAVLDLIIASELFQRYPEKSEGDLSLGKSNLVKKDTLALLAESFTIHKYITVGRGEKALRPSILADALEAIIGAIYLDGGIAACHKVVMSWYSDTVLSEALTKEKDAKTKLQEYLQQQKLPLPLYEVIKEEGKAHNMRFYISCHVPGLKITTKADGSSKQQAEQSAAAQFLVELGIK